MRDRELHRLKGDLAEYELLEPLGEGGVGQTWKAEVIRVSGSAARLPRKLAVKELVVIKMPNIDYGYDFSDIQAFLADFQISLVREFTALQRLDALGQVAHVLDVGVYRRESRRGPLFETFLAQEFIDGDRLDHYLERRAGADVRNFRGLVDPEDFFHLAEKLVELVRDVHQHGVIHGDLWPRNVMMRGEEAVLIDFGEAVFRDCHYRHLGRKRHQSNRYIAPEKLRGEREGRRSDIYSLGGVMYRMVTGEDPPLSMPDNDQLKEALVDDIQKKNTELLKRNCGIADIIARCRRYDKDTRTGNTDALLCEIKTFSFHFAKQSEQFTLADVVDRVRHAAQELENAGGNFFTSMVELELGLTAARIEDMSRGVLDLTGDHETLVSSLCRYLSILGQRDLLLIRSEPKLWASHNLGINGRFLSMNRLLAQRGARVRHLFLTCDEDRESSEVTKIFAAHRRVVRALRQEGCNGSVTVYYQTVPSAERKRKLRAGWQKAVIIKGGRTAVLEFVCDAEGRIRTIRFLSHAPEARVCMKGIVEELRSSESRPKPIENWFVPEVAVSASPAV